MPRLELARATGEDPECDFRGACLNWQQALQILALRMAKRETQPTSTTGPV